MQVDLHILPEFCVTLVKQMLPSSILLFSLFNLFTFSYTVYAVIVLVHCSLAVFVIAGTFKHLLGILRQF